MALALCLPTTFKLKADFKYWKTYRFQNGFLAKLRHFYPVLCVSVALHRQWRKCFGHNYFV